MTARKAPPDMFNPRLRRLRRIRSAKRGPSFINERCAHDLADRLQDINRRFQNALIIGSPEFTSALLAALPKNKTPANLQQYQSIQEDLDANMLSANGPFDLIISALDLHAVNDPPGTLIQMRTSLEPDGLFVGAMFGGDTLTEFRTALYAADEAAYGGMSPRIYPFADYSQAAQLLARGGFALPVVDSDRFQVHYKNWRTLVSDLRDLGETNSLNQTAGKPFPLKTTETAIAAMRKGGKFSVSFEILWLTGWRPHESQQKPLKPGSAKMRLADALGSKETKLPDKP